MCVSVDVCVCGCVCLCVFQESCVLLAMHITIFARILLQNQEVLWSIVQHLAQSTGRDVSGLLTHILSALPFLHLTHALTHTHLHAHSCTHTRTHAHMHAHTHTHAHTHICMQILFLNTGYHHSARKTNNQSCLSCCMQSWSVLGQLLDVWTDRLDIITQPERRKICGLAFASLLTLNNRSVAA